MYAFDCRDENWIHTRWELKSDGFCENRKWVQVDSTSMSTSATRFWPWFTSPALGGAPKSGRIGAAVLLSAADKCPTRQFFNQLLRRQILVLIRFACFAPRKKKKRKPHHYRHHSSAPLSHRFRLELSMSGSHRRRKQEITGNIRRAMMFWARSWRTQTDNSKRCIM